MADENFEVGIGLDAASVEKFKGDVKAAIDAAGQQPVPVQLDTAGMADGLREAQEQAAELAQETAGATTSLEQAAAASRELADSAQEQAASLTETAGAAGEAADSIGSVASAAGDVADATDSAANSLSTAADAAGELASATQEQASGAESAAGSAGRAANSLETAAENGKKLNDSTKEGAENARGMADSFGGVQGALAAAAGFGVSMVAITKSVSEAMGDQLADMQFRQVFAEGEEAAAEFASSTARAFALQEGEVKSLMAQTRLMAGSVGFAQERADELTKSVTTMAVQLAQLKGVAPEEAFQALDSALIGNVRALRRFGLAVQETEIDAAAMMRGWNPETIDKTQKALLILSLAQEKLGKATRGSSDLMPPFARALQELRTNTSELAGDIGKSITEWATPWVKSFADMTLGVRKFIEENSALSKSVVSVGMWGAGIATAIGGVGAAMAGVSGAIGVAKGVIASLNALSLAGFISTVATASTSLTAGLVPALGASVATMGLFSLATGVAAAALIGFGIGTVIADLLGLRDAFNEAERAAQNLANAPKTRAILDYGAGDNTALANMDDVTRQRAEAYRQNLELVKQNRDATERLNAMVAAGIDPVLATAKALNEQGTYSALVTRQDKLNADGKRLLAQLEAQYGNAAVKATQDAAAAAARNAESTRKLKEEYAVLEFANRKAEQTVAEARAKSTATINDDIELVKQRGDIEIKEAEQRAAATGKQLELAERLSMTMATDAKVRVMIIDEEQRELDALKEAERAAAEERARGTETLEDDLRLMREKTQEAINNAASERSAAAIKARGLLEERKLIDENTKARRESLSEYLKGLEKSAADRAGKGAEYDLQTQFTEAKKQAGNVQTTQDLERFKAAMKEITAGSLADSVKAAAESSKANPYGSAENTEIQLRLSRQRELAAKLEAEAIDAATKAMQEFARTSQPGAGVAGAAATAGAATAQTGVAALTGGLAGSAAAAGKAADAMGGLGDAIAQSTAAYDKFANAATDGLARASKRQADLLTKLEGLVKQVDDLFKVKRQNDDVALAGVQPNA